MKLVRSLRAYVMVCLAIFANCFSDVSAQAPENTNSVLSSLTELAKPARQIPFKEVVVATTGFRVLTFQTNNPAHLELRQQLLKAAALAGERAAAEGVV